MKSLEDYNKERREMHREYQEWLKNPIAGVLCDECLKNGEEVEMVYKNPGTRNLSYPPTSWVICPKCEKTGLKRH